VVYYFYNLKQKEILKMFNHLVEDFKTTQIWEDMSISEDSQWHREPSVKAHTMMTIEWYDNFIAKDRTPKSQLLTRVALLFHDTGKPKAKQLAKDGERFIYAGHELVSARLFEDYIIQHPDFIELSGLDLLDIRRIKWLIENHLPYGLTKPAKLQAFQQDLAAQGEDAIQSFFDMLQSDAHGRISDDHKKKLLGVNTWIDSLVFTMDNDYTCSSSKELHVLIGASGSGKSTLATMLKNTKDSYRFSLDDHRESFYALTGAEKDYSKAWHYCCDNDQAFTKYFQSEFLKALKTYNHITLDNTNTSTKSRRYWITLARQHGFKIIGYEFLINLSSIIARQTTRPDKSVPPEAVTRQYFSVTTPRIGSEVDETNIVLYGKVYPYK
jgi:predicted kinase